MSFDRDQMEPDFNGIIIHPPLTEDDYVPLYARHWCKENCEPYGACGWLRKNCPHYSTPPYMKEKKNIE